MSDAFASMWRVARLTGKPLHSSLPSSAFEIPSTINIVIRYREMIDGFMELPKDKRPPESIYFDSARLEEWFEDVFKTKSTSIGYDVNEVEG